jgi:hypothetical protein
MNINRNNYEEFFLLYVDNELSAAERNAVELFVQQNADLKEELNMLQQTVLNADDMVFDKTSLFKEEATAIQESLLLYVDDELNVADKLNIEKLIKTDTAVGKELAILQQTKLQPDTAIVFANKNILYRKEAGKVVGLPWRRIAAAAIITGFGIWGTVALVNNNKTTETTIVKNGEVKPTVAKKIQNTVQENTTATKEDTETVNTATTITENLVKQPAAKNDAPVNNKKQKDIPQQKNREETIAKEIKKPTNNLPKPDYNNFNKPNSNEDAIVTVPRVNTANDKINSGEKIINAVRNNTKVEGYALNTSFTEDEPVADADEDRSKKTKLGGFLRKVKRLVERNTNVTTGNGIKVAGFDIAIK